MTGNDAEEMETAEVDDFEAAVVDTEGNETDCYVDGKPAA